MQTAVNRGNLCMLTNKRTCGGCDSHLAQHHTAQAVPAHQMHGSRITRGLHLRQLAASAAERLSFPCLETGPEEPKQIRYQAESPDESALVVAAKVRSITNVLSGPACCSVRNGKQTCMLPLLAVARRTLLHAARPSWLTAVRLRDMEPAQVFGFFFHRRTSTTIFVQEQVTLSHVDHPNIYEIHNGAPS